ENDSSLDAVTIAQLGNTSTTLTLFSSMSPSFSNPGYVFAGWTTGQGGSGVSYADGATYNFTSGSVALYAKWAPSNLTVNYDANGGGVNPTTAAFSTGMSPLTLPSPTYSGYVFSGWYTASQAGILVGLGGGSYTPTTSLTLFAQWQSAVDTVNFVGDGANLTLLSESYGTGMAPIVLPTPTYVDYVFSGWYTAPQGGALVGPGGASYSPTSSTTLYAQWRAMPQFTINFVENGSAGAEAPITGVVGSLATISSSTPSAPHGFTFASWNTMADGSGTSYAPGQSLAPGSSVTLYAQWNSLTTVKIVFAGDGAKGTVASLSGVVGSSFTVPGPGTLSRAGFTFAGWNSAQNGSGTSFVQGDQSVLSVGTTLYAQWKKQVSAYVLSAVGPFARHTPTLTNLLKSQVRRLATRIAHGTFSQVTLYGYVNASGSVARMRALSTSRARAVAAYLRSTLRLDHSRPVGVRARGEGAMVGSAGGKARRVEVFVR
ncbi:MAG TPA: InlB B-repeat-containing protein, partial [Acidimicrobiales bacterium]|nr:InlB B-repeat-containing protein [Acidimicrobiales bacterium]